MRSGVRLRQDLKLDPSFPLPSTPRPLCRFRQPTVPSHNQHRSKVNICPPGSDYPGVDDQYYCLRGGGQAAGVGGGGCLTYSLLSSPKLDHHRDQCRGWRGGGCGVSFIVPLFPRGVGRNFSSRVILDRVLHT